MKKLINYIDFVYTCKYYAVYNRKHLPGESNEKDAGYFGSRTSGYENYLEGSPHYRYGDHKQVDGNNRLEAKYN